MFRQLLSPNPGGGDGPIPSGNKELDINPAIGAYQDINQNTACTNNTLCESLQNQGDNFAWLQLSESNKPTWYASDSSQNNKPYLEFEGDHMESSGSAGVFCMESDDCSIYAVVEPEDQTSQYATLLNKDLTYDWNKGWRLGFNDDARIDYLTNVGSCLGSTCAIANENEIENANASTSQAEIYTLRFKASSTPYVNVNYSTAIAGNSETGTTFEFADKDTPVTQITLAASAGETSSSSPAFEWNGKVFRIIGYSEYHDDQTHTDIVEALENLYGV